MYDVSHSEESQHGSGQPIEWNRIAALVATIAVLFFFTRSAPFPASTFWDLALARDFDLNIGWVFLPETLALSIADSSASLLGLKAVYHITFFLLCCLICTWVFKSREIMPGVLLLAVFSLSMQSFLSLRMLLQLIFIAGTLTILDNNRLKNNFGVILIPITAAASGLSLNSWLLVVMVACHAFYNDKYSPTLVLCALTGLLFFPEGAATAVDRTSVLAWQFLPDADTKIMYLLSGIFLLINLVSLHRLGHEDMPHLFFYAITGFMAVINPASVPIFILMGLTMLLKCFSEVEPLPLNYHLAGIITLTAIIHVFLFVNPFGFKLNPAVRGQLGKDLSPLLEGYVSEQTVYNHEIGELVWKGLVSLEHEDLPVIASKRDWKIVRLGNGEFELKMQQQAFDKVYAPKLPNMITDD
ncbi:MAG: hypothetical protein A2W80_11280 [Candidatus Riflebacteria bacterium GWC2_50_8]|nr:MAG: hypothetical protein A2W80_11280 [Candidatus Riflebacteria bacterium GWC2_50_8]